MVLAAAGLPDEGAMTQRDRTPLTTLRDADPATGVSRLRLLWPDIHAALELGHTIRAIHESLNQAGVSTSYRHLCSCIARFRLECDLPDALPQDRSVSSTAAGDRESDKLDPRPGNRETFSDRRS